MAIVKKSKTKIDQVNESKHNRQKQVKRKPSSTRWLNRQLKDPYVISAQSEGYRSRAAYKLIELDHKFRFLKPGQKVVDLGAAPGGWSQVAAERVKATTPEGGHILAIDIKPIDPIPGTTSLEGNLSGEGTIELVQKILGGRADIVLSDMAAPATGHRKTHAQRVMPLCEPALDFSIATLKPGGCFVTKILKVGAESGLSERLKNEFVSVKYGKPPASRKESSESYIIATGYRNFIK